MESRIPDTYILAYKYRMSSNAQKAAAAAEQRRVAAAAAAAEKARAEAAQRYAMMVGPAAGHPVYGRAGDPPRSAFNRFFGFYGGKRKTKSKRKGTRRQKVRSSRRNRRN